jgi:serpin B
VISPFSVQTALSMTMAGARGRTADEMYGAMQYPATRKTPPPGYDLPFPLPAWDHRRVHGPVGALAQSIAEITEAEQVELALANRIWPARGEQLKSAFTKTLKDHYGAGVTAVTYPEPGRTQINQWVSDQTREKIPELLKPPNVDAGTALVLVNAIYLKADWARKFGPEKTTEQTFHVSAEKTIKTPFMHMNAQLPVTQWADVTAVRLDYAGGRLQALLLLPDAGKSLDAVEKWLSPVSLDRLIERGKARRVDLALPKFEFRWRRELSAPLQTMGMKRPFQPGADFSGINGGGLFISQVIHEAYLKVDEAGSEAAAATAVVMMKTAERESLRVTFDRPFMMLIRDRKTGAVLFVGRVSEP